MNLNEKKIEVSNINIDGKIDKLSDNLTYIQMTKLSEMMNGLNQNEKKDCCTIFNNEIEIGMSKKGFNFKNALETKIA